MPTRDYKGSAGTGNRPPWKRDDKAIQAEMKNKVEAARFRMKTKLLDKEKMHTGFLIEKDKRKVVKQMQLMKNLTTGVSFEGDPPLGADDTDHQKSPYFQGGAAVSEKRLQKWRMVERQLERDRKMLEEKLKPPWEKVKVDPLSESFQIVMGLMGYEPEQLDELLAKSGQQIIEDRNRNKIDGVHAKPNTDVFECLKGNGSGGVRNNTSSFSSSSMSSFGSSSSAFSIKDWERDVIRQYQEQIKKPASTTGGGTFRRIHSAPAMNCELSSDVNHFTEPSAVIEKRKRKLKARPHTAGSSLQRRADPSPAAHTSGNITDNAPRNGGDENHEQSESVSGSQADENPSDKEGNKDTGITRVPSAGNVSTADDNVNNSLADNTRITLATDSLSSVATDSNEDAIALASEDKLDGHAAHHYNSNHSQHGHVRTGKRERVSFALDSESEEEASSSPSPTLYPVIPQMSVYRSVSVDASGGGRRRSSLVGLHGGGGLEQLSPASGNVRRRGSVPAFMFPELKEADEQDEDEPEPRPPRVPQWKRDLLAEAPPGMAGAKGPPKVQLVMSKSARRRELERLVDDHVSDVRRLVGREQNRRRQSRANVFLTMMQVRQAYDSIEAAAAGEDGGGGGRRASHVGGRRASLAAAAAVGRRGSDTPSGGRGAGEEE